MSKPQAPSLTLKRKLEAPAEKVFTAWTQPEALKHWFGPSNAMMVPLAEADVRIGGRYRIILREAGGEEHRVGGVYKEIRSEERRVGKECRL